MRRALPVQVSGSAPAKAAWQEETDALEALPRVAQRLRIFDDAHPESVTILPTYRCNAACAECCFESNSSIKHRMSRDELLSLIRRLPEELPGVKYLVFSGGEVTLLRQDLLAALALATKLGYGSRIVSNGHWGRTDRSAEWWVSELRKSGLTELNLSTGDEHQQFVPADSVARAALHAVRKQLTTLVTVEAKDTASFTAETMGSHPYVQEIFNTPELRKHFILMTNIWMPFHKGTDITNDNVPRDYKPCDNVLDNFVANPYGNLMSCCGLTMEYIPEMKVGHLGDGRRLDEVYRDQYSDLLKLWIWLDGTRYIFELAVERGGLNKQIVSPHMCSICAQIFRDPQIRKVVVELVHENAAQIVLRATVKARVIGRLGRSSDEGAIKTSATPTVEGGASSS